MKTIKLITLVQLISLLPLISLQAHAMSRAVAEEVCNQNADEEQLSNEERSNYILSCINNLSDQEIEPVTDNTESETQDKPD